MKRIKRRIGLALAGIFSAWAFYACCGLFVIQPIGAMPEGVTILYWRAGTSLPFVSSADGILLEQSGSVSLLARAVALGQLAEIVRERKIVNLPYVEGLYLISTGGRKFER